MTIHLTEIDWAKKDPALPVTVVIPAPHDRDEDTIRQYLRMKHGSDTYGYVGDSLTGEFCKSESVPEAAAGMAVSFFEERLGEEAKVSDVDNIIASLSRFRERLAEQEAVLA